MYKDKIVAQEYYKKYRIKNKETISLKNKEYRKKNREKLLAYQKEHYKNNKEMYRKSMSSWRKCNIKQYKKSLKSWEGFIPKKSNCELCGKEIFFNNGNIYNAVHFDHRHVSIIIFLLLCFQKAY